MHVNFSHDPKQIDYPVIQSHRYTALDDIGILHSLFAIIPKEMT